MLCVITSSPYRAPSLPLFVANNHLTRAANDLHVPRAKKCVRISSIEILGAQIWNDIPNSIRDSTTVATFKRNLKKHLIDSKLVIP